MSQIVQDREGRYYRLTVSERENNFLFMVHRQQRIVGESICMLESADNLLLVDIQIFHNIIRPLVQKTRCLITQEPTNYHNKGLGTHLLKFIIHVARQKGIKLIHGSIAPLDLKANPQLIHWYQKHGFLIEPPGLEEISDAIARISYLVSSYPGSKVASAAFIT